MVLKGFGAQETSIGVFIQMLAHSFTPNRVFTQDFVPIFGVHRLAGTHRDLQGLLWISSHFQGLPEIPLGVQSQIMDHQTTEIV